MHAQDALGAGAEQVRDGAGRGLVVEPRRQRFGFEDDGHAVVLVAELGVGLGGDDGEGIDRAQTMIGIEPGVPDAGEEHGGFVGPVDEPGLLGGFPAGL